MWGISKKLLGIKKLGSPTQVIHEGQMVNDPVQVANICNNATQKKVQAAIDKIPPSQVDPVQYTRDYVASLNKCTFEYPSCNITRGVGYREIKKAIKGLKFTNAAGVDTLCTRFVKMLWKPLLHVFTCICNRSFEQQIYPDLWQLSRVKLLCKDATQKFNPEKYRPVSVQC